LRVRLPKDGACVVGDLSPFVGAGEGFFRMELGAVLSSEVAGLSRNDEGVGLLLILTTGWACCSGGNVPLLRIGTMIPSLTPMGESGGACSWVFSNVGTPRTHRLSRSSCPSFPRAVKPPSKRELGRLSLVSWTLMLSPRGDLEVLRGVTARADDR
jgi:hypothetical protein